MNPHQKSVIKSKVVIGRKINLPQKPELNRSQASLWSPASQYFLLILEGI